MKRLNKQKIIAGAFSVMSVICTNNAVADPIDNFERVVAEIVTIQEKKVELALSESMQAIVTDNLSTFTIDNLPLWDVDSQDEIVIAQTMINVN